MVLVKVWTRLDKKCTDFEQQLSSSIVDFFILLILISSDFYTTVQHVARTFQTRQKQPKALRLYQVELVRLDCRHNVRQIKLSHIKSGEMINTGNFID